MFGDINSDGKADLYDIVELGTGWQTIYDFNTLSDISYDWLSNGHLVLHLPLDGDANDASDNQLDGTSYGPVTWSSSGYIDGAAEFDGSGDYIAIEDFKGVLGTQSRTCCAWIKTGVNQSHILTWGQVGSGTAWKVQTSLLGKLQLDVGNGEITGNTMVINNAWHHIAVVLEDDGSPDVDEVLLYVDGQPETTSSSSQAIDTATGTEVKHNLSLFQRS